MHKDKLKSTDAKATEDERKLGLWKKKRKSSVKKEDVAVDVAASLFFLLCAALSMINTHATIC